MKSAAIATTSLRRILRDRTALFFLLGLPVLIIIVIGTVTQSFEGFRIVVVDADRSVFSERLSDAISSDEALDVSVRDDADAATKSLRRAEAHGVVLIPRGYGDQLARGDAAEVTILGERTDETQRAARAAVEGIVASEGGRLQAAQFVATRAGGDVSSHLTLVEAVDRNIDDAGVKVTSIDAVSSVLPAGFTYSAPTMLVLFVFINCLAAGQAIIQNRELHLYDRILAGPVGPRTIVWGETLGYFGLALVQSALIVGVGALLFGVSWGDPIAAAALVGTWALVGTGAGILSGTMFKTGEQAGSIAPFAGIALGMLGGCMWPLEIVPPAMQTIGHLIPHGWAVDAWTSLIGEGVGITGIAKELLVLLAFAAVLIGVATMRLRRTFAG
jgi:ABC-2 type transport system permease protein